MVSFLNLGNKMHILHTLQKYSPFDRSRASDKFTLVLHEKGVEKVTYTPLLNNIQTNLST